MSIANDKDRIPLYCSWVVIVIVTALIWPLGAFLAWKRGQFSRKTCLNLGLISMVFGALFMVGAVTVAYLLGDSYMAYCAIYGISGDVFARMGYEGYKKSKTYRRVIFEVEDEGTLMVPMLADEIGMPEVDMIKTLEAMMKRNLLPDYELARNNKKLVKK